jgi:hypothetical protein
VILQFIRPWQRAGSLIVFSLFTSVIGCSDNGIAVSGRVKLDGKPIVLESRQVVKVALRPTESTKPPSMTADARAELIANVDQDGGFSIAGVPAGAYWVTVSDFPQFPHGDRLAAHFREEPKSIEVSISKSQPSIEVDLKNEWYSNQKGRR